MYPERGVEQTFVAVDAGSINHALISGLIHPELRQKIEVCDNMTEMVKTEKLTLLYPSKESNDELIRNIHRSLLTEGPRNYAAILAIMTAHGRQPRFRWTLDEHIQMLGYSGSYSRRLDVKQRISANIKVLTSLEAIFLSLNENTRERFKLFESRLFEEKVGDQWLVIKADLQLSRYLYDGVRRQNGALGINWYPSSAKLSQVDHHRFPFCIGLGLIIPIRLRLAMNEKKYLLKYTGENWLKAAGIERSTRNPWSKFQKTIEKLQEIDLVAEYEWDGRPWQAASLCQITPSDWIRKLVADDRNVIENPYYEPPSSGAELREWRKRIGLTQSDLAKKLQIGPRTIQRTEALPDNQPSKRLRDRIKHMIVSERGTHSTSQ